jgi:hypothetical protein
MMIYYLYIRIHSLRRRIKKPNIIRYHTHNRMQTPQIKLQTSMPRAGFKPKIQVFERAKTVHALDLAATVIGQINYKGLQVR